MTRSVVLQHSHKRVRNLGLGRLGFSWMMCGLGRLTYFSCIPVTLSVGMAHAGQGHPEVRWQCCVLYACGSWVGGTMHTVPHDACSHQHYSRKTLKRCLFPQLCFPRRLSYTFVWIFVFLWILSFSSSAWNNHSVVVVSNCIHLSSQSLKILAAWVQFNHLVSQVFPALSFPPSSLDKACFYLHWHCL